MQMAHAKMLRESLESVPESLPDDPLYDGLRQGDYDAYIGPERREWVDKHLSMVKNEQKKVREEQRNYLKKSLYPKKFQSSA